MGDTNTAVFQTAPTTADAPAAPAAAAPDRPAWLPENFKSVEDYAKALHDTKAELTRTQQELATLKKPEDAANTGEPAKPAAPAAKPADLSINDSEGDKSPEDKAAEEVAKEAGIDFAPYQDEFVSTGDISEDNRAKIAESLKGIFKDNARAIVDDYIEGVKQRQANARAQIVGVAGGEEGYAEMLKWAAANLSPEEKATYNAQVNSGDFHSAMFAAQGLKARYEAVKGRAPRLLAGDGPVINDGGAFKSVHEMKAAIADPRYSTDPDYRRSVEERVMKSNL